METQIEKWVEINPETGKATTTSLKVAEVFGKNHAHVLRDIRELSCSQQFHESNFGLLVEMRPLPQGGATKAEWYQMSKDGFSFLVMGYTGDKAGEFKERFISAFNQYEGLLKNDDYIINRALTLVAERNKALEQRIVQQTEQLAIQSKEIEEAAPKVEYFEKVLLSDSAMPITSIAKELGVSGRKLNARLIYDGIIYSVGRHYVLSARYQHLDYTKPISIPLHNEKGEPYTIKETYWTEKGRKFLLEKYGQGELNFKKVL